MDGKSEEPFSSLLVELETIQIYFNVSVSEIKSAFNFIPNLKFKISNLNIKIVFWSLFFVTIEHWFNIYFMGILEWMEIVEIKTFFDEGMESLIQWQTTLFEFRDKKIGGPHLMENFSFEKYILTGCRFYIVDTGEKIDIL